MKFDFTQMEEMLSRMIKEYGRTTIDGNFAIVELSDRIMVYPISATYTDYSKRYECVKSPAITSESLLEAEIENLQRENEKLKTELEETKKELEEAKNSRSQEVGQVHLKLILKPVFEFEEEKLGAVVNSDEMYKSVMKMIKKRERATMHAADVHQKIRFGIIKEKGRN